MKNNHFKMNTIIYKFQYIKYSMKNNNPKNKIRTDRAVTAMSGRRTKEDLRYHGYQ